MITLILKRVAWDMNDRDRRVGMSKIKISDCSGCYNEAYHSGLGGRNKCWHFDEATLSPGRKQHKDTLPKDYGGRWKLMPDCYVYRNGFIQRYK